MARPPLTEEERNRTIRAFIQSAFAIMEDIGPHAVTVRRVAEMSGYKPSTLYNYFDDAEHLAMCASLRYLSDYSKNLATNAAANKDPLEHFYAVWDHFNDAALEHPEAFHRLFFGKHRSSLPNVIDTYYQVFPEELAGIADADFQMMKMGSIEDRDLFVMQPLIAEGLLDEEKAPLINNIITACLRVMLEEKMDGGDNVSNESLKAKHHEQVNLLLGLGK